MIRIEIDNGTARLYSPTGSMTEISARDYDTTQAWLGDVFEEIETLTRVWWAQIRP